MRPRTELIALKVQVDAAEPGSRQQNGIVPSPTERQPSTAARTVWRCPGRLCGGDTAVVIPDRGARLDSPGDKCESWDPVTFLLLL